MFPEMTQLRIVIYMVTLIKRGLVVGNKVSNFSINKNDLIINIFSFGCTDSEENNVGDRQSKNSSLRRFDILNSNHGRTDSILQKGVTSYFTLTVRDGY